MGGAILEVVARGALALKAAECIDTVASPAEPWQVLALINICQEVRRPSLEAKPKQRTRGCPCPGLGTPGPRRSLSWFFRTTWELLDTGDHTQTLWVNVTLNSSPFLSSDSPSIHHEDFPMDFANLIMPCA